MTPNPPTTKTRPPRLKTATLTIALLLAGCKVNEHPYKVADEAMLPAFHPGDKVFVDESDQARATLQDGDIILIRRDNGVVLKRILAMPGEIIGGDHRKVFRNGQPLDEPYLAPTTGEGPPDLITFAPRTVSPGELFVMGDNRDISFDSRTPEYPPVHFSDVVGKYSWTYWHAPPNPK